MRSESHAIRVARNPSRTPPCRWGAPSPPVTAARPDDSDMRPSPARSASGICSLNSSWRGADRLGAAALCARPRTACTDACPNLHSKLGASQSFSRKITERNLLKLETDHTDHTILSFDAAETRQQTPGACPSDHNTACFVFLRQYLAKVVFFGNVDTGLVCR